MMSERSDYQNLVNEIETSHPVNEWKHNGYHLWPILRIRLMLMLLRQQEGSRNTPSTTEHNGFIMRIDNLFLSWLQFIELKDNTDIIYCGAPSHRINFKEKNYNRYFDPLMDKQTSKSLLLEYAANSKNDYYKPERVIAISDIEKCFNILAKLRNKIGKNNKYVCELDSIIQAKGFEVENFASETSKHIVNVDRAIVFWDKLLDKMNPKKIYELCYYSTIMMGLNISAGRRGIITADMQHGPYHWAYKSWKAIPEEGYEVLPDEFHAWNQSSADSINKWAISTTKHSAIKTGNPWVEGWKNGEFVSSNYMWPDNLILYTLQPSGDPLDPYLLETIKQTCGSWNWWLRLHPRQAGELADIENKLRQNNLLNKVNVTDATNLPLPEILINTDVHITKFSGCAIEAFSFGIPTIILDKRGEEMFEDYLSYEIMKSCMVEDSDILSKQIKSYM